MYCVSPSESTTNGRCSELALKNSKFCSEHSAKYTTLYLSYKKIETRLRYLISNTPTKESTNKYKLLKLYSCAHKAYKKRNEYRNKAFVPEEHDKGHALRIQYLWELTERCSNVLMKIFDSEESFTPVLAPLKIQTFKGKAPEHKEKDYKLITKIHKKQKRIYDTEKEFNTLIPKFIEERRALYNKNIKKYEEKNVILQKKLNLTYLKDYMTLVFLITKRVYLTRKMLCYRNLVTYISAQLTIDLGDEVTCAFATSSEVSNFIDVVLKDTKVLYSDPYPYKFYHNILQKSENHNSIKYRFHICNNNVFLVFPDVKGDNVIVYTSSNKKWTELDYKPSRHDKTFLNLADVLLGNEQAIDHTISPTSNRLRGNRSHILEIINIKTRIKLGLIDLSLILLNLLIKGNGDLLKSKNLFRKLTSCIADEKINREIKGEIIRQLLKISGSKTGKPK